MRNRFCSSTVPVVPACRNRRFQEKSELIGALEASTRLRGGAIASWAVFGDILSVAFGTLRFRVPWARYLAQGNKHVSLEWLHPSVPKSFVLTF